MREVSIDSLQQQVRTFWVESWEVHVFLWGGCVPPVQVTLTAPPPWGLSVHFSLLFFRFFHFILLCRLLLRCRFISLSGQMVVPSLAGCSVGKLGVSSVALSLPSPPSPPIPSPLPTLWYLPPRTLAHRACRAHCGIAGVFPLCGPPPGVQFMIRAMMSPACSLGVPLPPNG